MKKTRFLFNKWFVLSLSFGVLSISGVAFSAFQQESYSSRLTVLLGIGPTNFSIVKEGELYRSGQIQSRFIRHVLLEHHIAHVVNLGIDKVKTDQIAERKTCSDLNISRHTFSLNRDGTGPVQSYIDAIESITNARRAGIPVLVHCSAGAQRTTGVVALYQILIEGKDVSTAVAHALEYHSPEDKPALYAYLNTNIATIAQGLVDRGVIERLPAILPVFKVN